MKKEEKNLSKKEIGEKIKDLKIELLKQPAKRKQIRRKMAGLITVKNQKVGDNKQ